MPNVDRYIKFYKEDGKNVYDLTELKEITDTIEDIDSIDIYCNKHKVSVVGMDNCVVKDIFDC